MGATAARALDTRRLTSSPTRVPPAISNSYDFGPREREGYPVLRVAHREILSVALVRSMKNILVAPKSAHERSTTDEHPRHGQETVNQGRGAASVGCLPGQIPSPKPAAGS